MLTERIITQYIPVHASQREYGDWCAYRESDTGDFKRYAWGRTEVTAIRNLLAIEKERKREEVK